MSSHRGRSRVVSPVAVARRKSEERRLSDQIQVAYALDDIRLAKILLLRLKGIYVRANDDPRIDQVRDEDFDICFAPSGPLTLDDAATRAMQESRRRQRQWWHECQRAQRLRACERIWEDLHHAKPRRRDQRQALPTADPFQYTFLAPKSANKVPSNRTVPFKEVIDAMNGKLFPPDPSERADDARRIAGLPIAATSSHKRMASVRAELLDALLHVVEQQQDARRTAKGKDVDRSQQSLQTPLPPPTPILTVSAPPMSSSTSPSRSSSWLSFGSWRSTATDITTPDSPVLPSPTSHSCLIPTLIETQYDPHPRCAFVRISLEESPLFLQSISPAHHDHTSPTPSGPVLSLGIRDALTRSVATILGAAKGLQSAYITATMFTIGFPFQDSDTSSQPPRLSQCHPQVRREGYRALANDVRRFTDDPTPITQTCREPVHFIPLVSPSSVNPVVPNPPLSKDVVIFPSPLRPRTPPTALAYRMRPVANPAVLRLRALQNVMYARGKQWEGRAREGALGCGKERLLGIAFEGRGPSGLGCEVRFVVA